MSEYILTPDNSSQMARDDPDGAYEFDGAIFHGNECSFSSSSHDGTCAVRCIGLKDRGGCGYEKSYADLQRDDAGYYVVPALCPRCYLNDRVSGVRTRNPTAKPEVLAHE